MPIERTKTGIKGLDELIEGGFPTGNTILVTGTPGTGKTIFGLEYVYNGVTKFKERSLYVSFEQPVKMLVQQAKQFGWDLESLMEKGAFQVDYIPIKDLKPDTADMLVKKIQKEKIRRLVVDSISTLAINAPIYMSVKDISLVDIMKGQSFFSPPILGDLIVKRFIYNFVDALHIMDHTCTTLLLSESAERGEYLSRDTVSEFIVDGVILITFESMGGAFSRSLSVRKMRHTKNDEDVHPLEISSKGLVVHKLET